LLQPVIKYKLSDYKSISDPYLSYPVLTA